MHLFAADTIRIATFNIQVFGKAKMAKPETVRYLCRIIKNFDIVAVQEIRDASGESLPYFVRQLNAGSPVKYDYIISKRLGRSKSKEQYAFIYNPAVVQYTGKSWQWPDHNDTFEREPFLAFFRAGNFDFVLANIHTKPEDTKYEVRELVKVIHTAAYYFKDNDIIVLGDFNADGSYFSEKKSRDGLRENVYSWLVSDSFDTTVTPNNDNTYDRIVVPHKTVDYYTGTTEVFRFDEKYGLSYQQAKLISDHYPVWAEFYTGLD